MPLVITDPGGVPIIDYPPQQVEINPDPSDSGGWVTSPYLWCIQLKLACNAYSTALLRYEVGSSLIQPGGATKANYQPLDLRGKYVRIIIPQDLPLDPITWVGYILSDNLARDGVKNEGGVNKFKGEAQLLQAVGLEYLLDRKQVESSRIEKTAAPFYVEIQRALRFNGGESSTIDMKAAHRGNRAAALGPDNVYLFSKDPTTSNQWTATQIVMYLLKYFTTRNTANVVKPVAFKLDDFSFANLDGFHPTIVSEGQTVFKLLNQIIAPQRGLCWWLEFDSVAATPVAIVKVASLARNIVTLTGANTLPANTDQIQLNFDNEVDVKTVDVKTQGRRNYQRVTVRGARQTSTFTIGIQDGTLIPDWKAALESDYRQGAIAEADYGGLSTGKQAERNDAMRVSDRFGRVFSYFRIPADWDGQSGDGAAAAHLPAIAILSPTGSVLGVHPLSTPAIRLLNKTRLKESVNYANPAAPINNAPAGSLESFVAPFALVQVEKAPLLAGAVAPPERWQYVDKLHDTKFNYGTKVGPPVQCSFRVRAQEHLPGVIIEAGSTPAHAIALNHWAAAQPSQIRPMVSYDSLRVTVCAEADHYATGVYEAPVIPANAPVEELIIDLGDDYRLDFLAKNTIIDLDKGVPVLASTAAVLRDDRSTLRDVARIAFEWYREDRFQLTVEFRQLRNLFKLGQLITDIGSGATAGPINTVISCITYKFDKEGLTTVETMDDTLDIRVLRGGIT